MTNGGIVKSVALVTGGVVAILIAFALINSGDEAPASDLDEVQTEQDVAADGAVQSGDADADSADEETELQITVDMEVAQIGDDFIRFRIEASDATAFTSVVRQDGEIVVTQEGLLNAGETLTERIEGLEPGELYTVQSTLIGPPAVTSLEVLFRTNGDIPNEAEDSQTPQVNITSIELGEIGPTHFQFDYFTDQCANGSFVIIEQATGEEVGRNNGGPESCVDRSLGVPGVWTPPLEAETTYVVTVTAEANGTNRGRPYGNADTETLVVTTPPRPIPDDPAERTVPPVEFSSVEVMETSTTTVRVDYTTNVCTNGSFVVREVGGSEVGRHPGTPQGCTTNHSAIAGLWTEQLSPDTDYVIVLTAEADGAGQGLGNIATESIDVQTLPELTTTDAEQEQVSIERIETAVVGETATAQIVTNVCANIRVSTFEQPGLQLGDVIASDTCSQDIEISDLQLAPEGNTLLIVNAEASESSPQNPNTASEVVVLER